MSIYTICIYFTGILSPVIAATIAIAIAFEIIRFINLSC